MSELPYWIASYGWPSVSWNNYSTSYRLPYMSKNLSLRQIHDDRSLMNFLVFNDLYEQNFDSNARTLTDGKPKFWESNLVFTDPRSCFSPIFCARHVHHTTDVWLCDLDTSMCEIDALYVLLLIGHQNLNWHITQETYLTGIRQYRSWTSVQHYGSHTAATWSTLSGETHNSLRMLDPLVFVCFTPWTLKFRLSC